MQLLLYLFFSASGIFYCSLRTRHIRLPQPKLSTSSMRLSPCLSLQPFSVRSLSQRNKLADLQPLTTIWRMAIGCYWYFDRTFSRQTGAALLSPPSVVPPIPASA
ncbi:hypothetical protein EI94DRAFT_1737779 [Lactarius quietus]|nr:hypothetical protein EI94DRAFT_1737779 [Lactarius quietus]